VSRSVRYNNYKGYRIKVMAVTIPRDVLEALGKFCKFCKVSQGRGMPD